MLYIKLQVAAPPLVGRLINSQNTSEDPLKEWESHKTEDFENRPSGEGFLSLLKNLPSLAISEMYTRQIFPH